MHEHPHCPPGGIMTQGRSGRRRGGARVIDRLLILFIAGHVTLRVQPLIRHVWYTWAWPPGQSSTEGVRG